MANGFQPTHRAPGSGLLAWNSPSDVREVTGRISRGTDLQVLQHGDRWALVRTAAGITGWVDATGLQAISTTRTRTRNRWFVALAAVVVLALVAGGALFYFRTRTPQSRAGTGGTPISTTAITTAGLLSQAYASGRIDRPTWLRYRVYSMFGVDALPGEFRTSTPNEDDAAVAAELQLGDALPPDARAELMSFLGRPANPGSVFHGKGPVQTAAQRVSGARLADTVVCGADNWTSRHSTLNHAYRVWTRCTGTYDSRLSNSITAMDALWPPMTTMMGNPIPDLDLSSSDPASYGGDGYIDIYLVPRDTNIHRSGGDTLQISGLGGALTVAAAPFDGNRSSGYMLLDEAKADSSSFPSTLAHEFFHVLESAHNYKAQFDRVRLHMEENWFTEASSVWAQSYFVRDTAAANAYSRWVVPFLKNLLPIDARGVQGTPEWYHQYADFLWLYFMEQERGSDVIKAAWSDASFIAATNGADATAAWDLVFSFGDNFEAFALRNLNDPAFKPVTGKLYQDLDPRFPATPQDANPPVPPRAGKMFVNIQSANDPPSSRLSVNVEHLTAGYYEVNFNADVDQVKFNLSGLAANPHVRANLIVLPLSGSPVPRLVNLPVTDQETQLCDVKKIERAILVVSNGDLKSSSSGNILASGTSAPCAPMLTVTKVAPNSVQENSTVTIVITGSGFTTPGLKIDITINSPADPGVQCPCSIPPQPILKVVSDTEIDYTALFSTSAPPGAFDVTVLDDATVGQPMPIQAVCTGCLTLTPLQ